MSCSKAIQHPEPEIEEGAGVSLYSTDGRPLQPAASQKIRRQIRQALSWGSIEGLRVVVLRRTIGRSY